MKRIEVYVAADLSARISEFLAREVAPGTTEELIVSPPQAETLIVLQRHVIKSRRPPPRTPCPLHQESGHAWTAVSGDVYRCECGVTGRKTCMGVREHKRGSAANLRALAGLVESPQRTANEGVGGYKPPGSRGSYWR